MLTIMYEWDARYEERKADAMTFFETTLVIARAGLNNSLR